MLFVATPGQPDTNRGFSIFSKKLIFVELALNFKDWGLKFKDFGSKFEDLGGKIWRGTLKI